jgi:hypothetical protein
MARKRGTDWETVSGATTDILERLTCADRESAREVIWQMYANSSLSLDGFMRCMLSAWRDTQAADKSAFGFVERLNSERYAAVGRSMDAGAL